MILPRGDQRFGILLQGVNVMQATIRHSVRVVAIAALLGLATSASFAQNQSTQQSGASPLGTRVAPAPVGHRQPRAADIKPSEKTAAEIQEEKLQAELERKLKICRGC